MCVEIVYHLTMAMSEAAINEQRADLELYEKRINRKLKALSDAISSITDAFLHIQYSEPQCCFFKQKGIDEKKAQKLQKMRNVALGKDGGRGTCDCCLLL